MSSSETVADPVSATAHLARRDPALPRLRTMLDDAALSAWLSGALGEQVAARRTYLRYKPGTAVVLAVSLTAGPETLPPDLVVQHWAAAAREKVAKVRTKAVPGSVVHLEQGSGLVVTTPAGDRHLPALRRLLVPRSRSTLLGDLLPSHPEDGPTELDRLSYKPHRRWVGALDTPGGRLLLRVYPPAELGANLAGPRALSPEVAPVVPVVAMRRRLGIAAFAWADGRQLALPADAHRLPALGAGLARLHGVRTSLASRSVEDRAEALGSTVELASLLLPELAARLASLRSRSVAALSGLSSPHRATLHGDLSVDQVVLAPDGSLRLVDLDRCHVGDPAEDLGSLAASCLLAGHDAREVLQGLAEGYDAPVPAPAAVAAWTLAHLLLRSTDDFRTAAPDWPAGLARAVRLAEGVAARSEVPR